MWLIVIFICRHPKVLDVPIRVTILSVVTLMIPLLTIGITGQLKLDLQVRTEIFVFVAQMQMMLHCPLVTICSFVSQKSNEAKRKMATGKEARQAAERQHALEMRRFREEEKHQKLEADLSGNNYM